MGALSPQQDAATYIKEARTTGVLSVIAVIVWLGGIHFNCFLWLVCLLCLPNPWAIAILAIWCSLILVPIQPESVWGAHIARWICKHAPQHFPIKVHVEDYAAFDPEKAYVIALEPHSVLPIGILGIAEHNRALPMKRLKLLASNAIFWTPIVNHIWSWLGLAPATKSTFRKLLRGGTTVAVVPGGVQECLYMTPGEEVIFLKRRFGFVKLAMEAGAPLVPSFCFGQSQTYRWWRPNGPFYEQISRRIGFTPLWFWGMFGSPVPYPSPMTIVVGTPIPVAQVQNPTNEEVAETHSRFLAALEDLFNRNKAFAGHKDMRLRIL